MDYKVIMVDALRAYRQKEAAMVNIRARLDEIDAELKAIRSANTDGIKVKSGIRSDRVLNLIVERDDLRVAYRLAKSHIERVNRGLQVLDEAERKVIFAFFIDRKAGVSTDICDILHCEKSEAYRKKDAALRKLTVACYGITEL